MSADLLRVGLVGAGANTRARHIPGLRALPNVALVAVCNRRRASTEQVAAEFNIPRVYDRWEDLVRAPDVDAVVIGTWPNLHAPVTLAALSAGKHVLCEARMAMNADEARAMRDAARTRPRLVAQLVPAPFTLSADATIRRLLADGFLGRLLAVNIRAGNAFLDESAPLHWRQNADLSGMNVLTLGIWYESLLRWTGPATRVMAQAKIFVPERRNADGVAHAIRLPDHLDVLADLADSAQLHLQVSAVTGLAGEPEAWLFGSAGTLRFCADRLWGGRKHDAELRELEIPAAERGKWRVEEEFVDAIRGRAPVRLTTFDDGVR